MKKSLLKKSALFCAASMFALTAMAENKVTYPDQWIVDNFEDGNVDGWVLTPADQPADQFAIFGNDEKSALNPSNYMVCTIRRANDAVTTNAKYAFAKPIPAGTYKYAHVMVNCPMAQAPNIKISETGANIAPVAAMVGGDDWTDLVFALPEGTALDYFMFVYNVTPTIDSDALLLIDNIVLNNSADPRTATIDAAAKVDPTIYKAKGENGKYILNNNWIYSVVEDNFNQATIHATGTNARGAESYDGKLYICSRLDTNHIVVINGETGSFEKEIILKGEHIFEYEKYAGTDTTEWVGSGSPCQDIHFDSEGNCLVANMITSKDGHFQVYKVDLETGAAVKILDEVLGENTDFAEASIRFDAFGVTGDIEEDGIIMAQSANAMEAYKWQFENGNAGAGVQIALDDPKGKEGEGVMPNPGTAPRIYPIDDTYFYLDGNATLPTLYDMDGNLVDNFYDETAETYFPCTRDTLFGSHAGETEGAVVLDTTVWQMNEGHNGLVDFELYNEETEETEYFLACAATNTVAKPFSSYAIIKYKDGNKSFNEATRLFTFPEKGFGATSNAVRTATVGVDVKDNVADLYLYVVANGYAKYTFTNTAFGLQMEVEDETAVDNVEVNNGINLFVNNNTVTLSEIANIEVYTLLGQRIMSANEVESFNIENGGIYIVKTINAEGVASSNKVIIK